MLTTQAPLNVTLKVTNVCNLACKHCHSSSSETNQLHMSKELFKKIVCQLRETKVFGINISGGEPLLHPNIFEFINKINDTGLRVSISTNATLITEEIAKDFIKQGIKGVHVSLDGDVEGLHEKIRNKAGSFQATIKGINILVKHKIPVMIVTVISDQTPEEYERIIDYAYELKAGAHKTNALIPSGKGKYLLKTLSDKYLKKHIEIFKKKKNQYRKLMEVKGEMGFLMQMGCDEYVNERSPAILNVGCSAGINTCAILENGDVSLCSFAPEIVCGNISKTNFKTIWKESIILKNIRRRDFVGNCGECQLLMKCGGCRARAFTDGNLYGSDPYCWKHK